MFRKWQTLRKRSKGFTLIELMIVVAIIAILAAIAIPQYKKFQLKAKTTEAKTNLGAIRTAEEAYAAENDVYIGAGLAPGKSGSNPRNFNANSASLVGFNKIGFQPAGKVRYSYGVGTSVNTPADNTENAVTQGNVDIYIFANADLDGDGTKAYFGCTDEDPKIVDKTPGEF